MKNICYLLRAGEVESLVGRQDPQQELVQQLDRAAGVANTSAETGVIVQFISTWAINGPKFHNYGECPYLGLLLVESPN